MLRFTLLAVLSLIWSLPAFAQGETRWSHYSSADRSDIIAMASICPLLDTDVTGNFFCISLGCTTRSALEWRVEFAGAGVVPDNAVIQFAADGIALRGIPMMRLRDDRNMGYSAAYDATRDSNTVAAMARGASGRIGFDTRDLNGRDFSLAGAAAALQSTLAQCPATTARAAPPPVQTIPVPAPGSPRDAALNEIAGYCGVAPAQLSIAQGFETVADITGDGRDDVILNYGAVTCPGAPSSQFCGSGGCTHAVWASQADGSLRQVFSDTIFGMTAGWMPVLTVQAHGSACGRTGASGPCTLSFRVAPDGTLTRMD